jgi:pimeloyl-ACP methyl ester carboxylesterase
VNKVISRDGTPIAFDRVGSGPPLILVDGALCSRRFGPSGKLAPLLARDFTVFSYDRRGRGDSGDTKPYAKQREIDDLAALIEAAGGSASLLGLSSGAALALEAAAGNSSVRKVAAFEPPFVLSDDDARPAASYESELNRLIAARSRAGAVKYFMRTMMGVPAIVVLIMQLFPGVWSKLKAVAHTLPYDAAVMGDFSLPAERLRAVKTPTLVMDGGKTDARLRRAVEGVAKAVPNAVRRTLPGQTHNVKPEVLAPVVAEFLLA